MFFIITNNSKSHEHTYSHRCCILTQLTRCSFRIFIPIIIFVFLSICCVGFCKIFQRVRKEREERVQAQDRAMDQSVYVIPISLSDDELYRPPRYSTVQSYEPPPSYHEVTLNILWNTLKQFSGFVNITIIT